MAQFDNSEFLSLSINHATSIKLVSASSLLDKSTGDIVVLSFFHNTHILQDLWKFA
jgi:hypothetical protein